MSLSTNRLRSQEKTRQVRVCGLWDAICVYLAMDVVDCFARKCGFPNQEDDVLREIGESAEAIGLSINIPRTSTCQWLIESRVEGCTYVEAGWRGYMSRMWSKRRSSMVWLMAGVQRGGGMTGVVVAKWSKGKAFRLD